MRREKEGWKKQLHIRALESEGSLQELTQNASLYETLRQWKELPLQEFLKLTHSTAATAENSRRPVWQSFLPRFWSEILTNTSFLLYLLGERRTESGS